MRLFAIKIPDQPIPQETFDKLALLIEPQGRERIKRFRLPEDALRSLVARLTMTWYLYINNLLINNELPTFGRKGKGKPILETPKLYPPLEFNNTHESSYILFCLLRSNSPLSCIGIDIMSPVLNPLETQEGISLQLTIKEKLSLNLNLNDIQRNEILMKFWTLKESFTKAIGEGITFGLERIEVLLKNNNNNEIEKVKIDGKDSNEIGWQWKQDKIGKENCIYSIWWRGEDFYPDEDCSMQNVNWEEFEKPLLELVDKLNLK
ncbi:uncharacterized protein I206_107622 [Kwoniella pini CBS 10737]|uniref:holo-[acyl-carrier-protein] synthase n=1 Tax=Kwoniella pini CBS 10737 TaxID=1296096 RepID=A0A1B9HXX2_9TREE|nr:uncharacterized protein I206_05955 [Kwoniella pini CBS 10737]OCF48088.1 hypothetical protein I206_05955 [Kwoniella pini CBS 10737]